MQRHVQAHGWWRDHYDIHPRKGTNGSDAWASGKSQKYKMYCKECWIHHFAGIKEEHRLADQNGTVCTYPREDREILEYLWSQSATDGRRGSSVIGYRLSASSTLVNHLATCDHQTAEVKMRANEDASCTLVAKSRRLLPPAVESQIPSQPPYPPHAASSTSHLAGPSTHPSSGTYPDSPMDNQLQLNFESFPPSPLVAIPGFLRREESMSVLGPEDSASAISGGSSLSNRSHSGSHPSSNRFTPRVPSTQLWTASSQTEFENHIARITVSANLPLSWVDNPEVITFMDKYIPAATSPSRKVLTKRIIPKLVDELQTAAKKETRGKNATVQADGWTGGNHRHLVAFMITADKKVYTIRVHDASVERKTADKFLALLEEVVKEIEEKWGSLVVAVVTDASGECRKARREFVRKYPWVIVLDCFAHQINLVVGDYFGVDSLILEYTEKASDLITWLRSKTIVLGLLSQNQRETNTRILTILRAMLTRWTSHLRAYERLNLVRHNLISIAYQDEARLPANKLIVTGDAKAKAKSQEMLDLIKNNLFWHSLTRVVHHLRPLGIAANVIQSQFCRLDTVLLTFGLLMVTYQAMTEPDDLPGCTAIINSLEKRWLKTDQEIFIATLIMNPFFGRTPFAHSPHFNNAGIIALLDRVWKRIFQTDSVPVEFYNQLHDYLNKSGEFVQLDFTCERQKLKADGKREAPDPTAVYDDYRYGQEDRYLFQLGRKLLSITANSASCERLFSEYGIILSKRQTRLLQDHMMQRAQLKAQIRDEHLRDDSKRKRAKQHFSSMKDRQQTEAAQLGTMNPTPGGALPLAVPSSSTNIPSSSNDSTSESSAAPDQQVPETFRSFVDQQRSLVTEDNTDDEPLFNTNTLPTPGTQATRLPLLKLTEVFDFSNTHWVEAVRSAQENSFEKELEFYELLDLDGEGEDDMDIDNTTEQVLGFE